MEDVPGDRLADIIYGIRNCVLKAEETLKDSELEEKDYSLDAKESFLLVREKRTFAFKDYAPKVFAAIRKLLGVSTSSFLESWEIPEDDSELKESTARSGSMFYTTKDRKYIFKTILHPEVTVMMEILKNYYIHLQAFHRTFMVKIYGLFRYMSGTTKLWILIMGHTFPPSLTIQEKYDLKGRKPKPGKSIKERAQIIKPNAPQKDNEIERNFRFVEEHKDIYLTQLSVDIQLLKTHDIMDYSLLVGIHEVTEEEFQEAVVLSASNEGYFSNLPTEIKFQIQQNENYMRIKTEREKKSMETEVTRRQKKSISSSENNNKKKKLTEIKTSGEDISNITDNALSAPEKPRIKKSDRKSYERKYPRQKSSDHINKKILDKRDRDKDTGKLLEIKTIFDYGLVAIHPFTQKFEILFLGIIDNLTNYTVSKQMANLFKSALWEAETLSTVPSIYYGDRFYNYLTTVILGDRDYTPSDDFSINIKPDTTNDEQPKGITIINADSGKTHSISQPVVPIISQYDRIIPDGTNSVPNALTPREKASKQKSLRETPLSDLSTQKAEKRRKSMGQRDN